MYRQVKKSLYYALIRLRHIHTVQFLVIEYA